VIDWLRHLLGLPCRRLIVGHEFVPLSWAPVCGYIPDPRPYRPRCLLPARCHDGG
jgi:hypothetical protein